MGTRQYSKLVAIFVFGSILTSGSLAQNEQWLQYRSAVEARQIVMDIGYQYLQPSSAKPAGVELPAFTSDQPLFLEWKTSMAASGTIWLAFDKSKPNGQYDRLYLDANANGDLSDDPALQPYRRDSVQIYFGPAKVVFDSADGPITYHLSIELRVFPQQTHCLLTPACWYEGQITVGGVKKQCLLIDHNVNGAFNDKSLVFTESDRIRIGEPSGPEAGAVGNYIE
ncbi:MAG: hypothetical protein FJ280_19480, partial [Planctomycetes bacterium]|nr:hypothetical protein [Planctomycetota bacterium]